MNRQEQSLQTAICTYLKMQYPLIPFKVDHGASQNKVSYIERKIYAKQSFRRGFPDFQMIKPSKYYFGLFFELKGCKEDLFNKNGTAKRGTGDHIAEQYEFCQLLNQNGYYACFVWDIDNAIDLIKRYINNEELETQVLTFNSLTRLQKADIEADRFFGERGL
jgi:hypothetical protein